MRCCVCAAEDGSRVHPALLAAAAQLRVLARRAGVRHGAGGGRAQPQRGAGRLPRHARHAARRAQAAQGPAGLGTHSACLLLTLPELSGSTPGSDLMFL